MTGCGPSSSSSGVIDAEGRPTAHFGDPRWVYVEYCKRKGDTRSEAALLAEAEEAMARVRARSVPLAVGYGASTWELESTLDRELHGHYEDSKRGHLDGADAEPSLETVPEAVRLRTQAADRRDYILHPVSGEKLDAESVAKVEALRARRSAQCDVQIVLSDGLDPRSLMDRGRTWRRSWRRCARELEAAGCAWRPSTW